METRVTPLTGYAVRPAVAETAGTEGFLGVLEEVAGGGPAAAATITLSPTPAGGWPERGHVAGQPDLSYEYRPDELTVTISRTGADGASKPVASLKRDGAGALHDGHGNLVGQILADGTVSFEPSWAQGHGSPAPLFDVGAGPPTILADPVPDDTLSRTHTGGPPPVTVSDDVETFPADQPSGPTHTGAPPPQVAIGHTETFPAGQERGPTIMEARPQPPIEEIPAPADTQEGTRSYKIGENTITLSPQPGGTYKADVTIKEDFGDVVRSPATRRAGADARAQGEDGDVGFHTIAHRFFPGLTETIVPGNGGLNGSDYRAMENRIAAGVARGETVTGTINPLPEDSARPQQLFARLHAEDPAGNKLYPIGGIFPNKAPSP